MNPAVVDALTADDKSRSDFLRACLLKMGLHVSPQEQALPSLSPIHFSSVEPNAIRKVLVELQKENAITKEGDEEVIKGPVDTFALQRVSDVWSMSSVTKAIIDTAKAISGQSGDAGDEDPDKIIDYEKIVKRLIAHEDQPPTAQEVPYFNHDAYFLAHHAYINSERRALYANLHVGKHLMYGQVVTSTSTLLEKYVSNQ